MRRFARFVSSAALVAVLVSAVPSTAAQTEDGPRGAVEASVVAVLDGATVRVRIGPDEEEVRLLGLDPPAPGTDDRPEECYGIEALRRAQDLLPEGHGVRLEQDDADRDPSGRLVRYAWIEDVEDGSDVLVNELLVRRGIAAVDSAAESARFAERLTAAEKRARNDARGLWRACGEAHAPVAAPPTALAIPAIGIDAAVEEVAIVDGVMGTPTDPWNVGWYRELGAPGRGVNVVMAGHVDWAGIGRTVFADLDALGGGEEILVTGADGETHSYFVTAVWTVGADSSGKDVADVVGPTEGEALTLITCTGDFINGAYTSRLILRAEPADGGSGDLAGQTRVTLEDLNLRSDPSLDADVLQVIPAGSTVTLTGKYGEDGYVEIEYEGTTGWVAAEYLGE